MTDSSGSMLGVVLVEVRVAKMYQGLKQFLFREGKPVSGLPKHGERYVQFRLFIDSVFQYHI
jgi:hypothetical protein